jgi:hypothetical protein
LLLGAMLASLSIAANAATITVNSLADDVFPDAAGAIFNAAGAAIATPISPAKCTLRMAIATANLDFAVGGASGCTQGSGADTIQFDPSLTAAGPATILLNGTKRLPTATGTNSTSLLLLTADTTITGPTGSNTLSISAGGSRTSGDYRILFVTDTIDNTLINVSISNLIFRDSRVVAQFDQSVVPTVVRGAGGGCLGSFETITLTNVTFDNCTSQGASEPGVPTNYSSGSGGAFWVGAASASATAFPNVTMNQVTAKNSQAYRSATAYAAPVSPANFVSFAGCLYVGGRTVGVVSLTDVSAENCEADNWGGVAVQNASAATINGLTVTRSRAIGSRNSAEPNIDSGYTGGISLRGSIAAPAGTMTATNVTASFNVANSDRGGVEIRSLNSFTGSNFDVLENAAGGYVGGIEVRDVVAGSLSDALIFRNTAMGAYGGLRARLNNAARTFTFSNIAVVHNLAVGNSTLGGGAGGVQFESDGIYKLINSTVAFNRVGAGYFGSGLQVNMHSAAVNGIDVLISNSTIARNQAQGNEALGAFTFATPTPMTNGRIIVQSSILGNRDGVATQNTVGAGTNEAAKITYSSTLVEGPNTGVLNQATVCASGGMICGVNAQLTPLVIANAGLPFSLPIVLLPKPSSPALNVGTNPLALTLDMRGQPRAVGLIDMGAIETQASELIGACTLDMDAANGTEAFREGLVLLRSMLGFTSSAAVANTGISESQWNATKANLNANCGTNLQ